MHLVACTCKCLLDTSNSNTTWNRRKHSAEKWGPRQVRQGPLFDHDAVWQAISAVDLWTVGVHEAADLRPRDQRWLVRRRVAYGGAASYQGHSGAGSLSYGVPARRGQHPTPNPRLHMTAPNLNWIANYIWGIADDVLRDVYVRGKYRDVILPTTVLRRLDAVLEPTKQAVLDMKATLDAAGIANQDAALRQAAGQAFHNTSKFTVRDLRKRATPERGDFRHHRTRTGCPARRRQGASTG